MHQYRSSYMIHSLTVTYSMPWQKHGVLKSMPTSCSFCPCVLLSVIAKQSQIGNYTLLNWKGSSLSEEVLSSLYVHTALFLRRCNTPICIPLSTYPELLHLSAIEALHLSHQENCSSSLPPALDSCNKQNLKGCAFMQYI